jgi:hypothetical protein
MEMHNKYRAILLYLFLGALLAIAGCSTSETTKTTYPALAEIPPIQEYSDDRRSWSTDAVCWVGAADDAKWKWNLPLTSTESIRWVREDTPATIQQLIREELQSEGYEIKAFTNEYLTRQKRLMLHKLILFEAFEITKTMVREGACFDMKLTVKIVDNLDPNRVSQSEIWGRSLLLDDKKKQWVDIYRDCVTNIRRAPEFRQSLELSPVALSK